MTDAAASARASRHRGARALFTSRTGPGAGVSTGDFAELNLALHVGDDPRRVAANRAALEAAVGRTLVFVDQVHSAGVAVVTEGEDPARWRTHPRTADAIVTARDDVALAIMVADCMPVLLADHEAGVIGAAHAGRPGLLAGVLRETVGAMRDLGARPERIEAQIGPSVCGDCYEVPAAMRNEAERTIPGIGARTRGGTPSLDLRRGAVLALSASGVPESAVRADAPCTLEDPAYFSYRRARRTGRFAGIIHRA